MEITCLRAYLSCFRTEFGLVHDGWIGRQSDDHHTKIHSPLIISSSSGLIYSKWLTLDADVVDSDVAEVAIVDGVDAEDLVVVDARMRRKNGV